ncbi:MAG: nucleotidyltransferase family protein [Clostridia bacterium]|nr:nucleotidyltransferase family protein [Clostridia bacterium]
MKCVVLAAGYATRLYPLTENFPKPLLEVAGKTILDRLLEDIDTLPEINEHIIISNARYAQCFEEWKINAKYKNPITILNDGTISNETRLGAVRDVQFAIDTLKLQDDLLVIAGDNILDFSFVSFAEYYKKVNTSVVMCSQENDINVLRRCGVMIPDENFRLISMEEKPQEPKSNWCVGPFYIYKSTDLHFVREAIESGCKTDAPGSFICYLCEQTPVHALVMPGKRYDIGTLESYEEVKKIFKNK